MSDQDPTHGDDATRDDATPTQPSPTEPAPSPDSIRTRAPSSYPDTRFEHGASTPLQGSTDTYATAHPGATPTVDREVPLDAFPGHELLEKLGEGAMGIVYKARQTGLNRLVAFEMILGGHRAGPKDLIRFLVEAEAVASIKHPHVVQVHEYGQGDNRPFLAMEYLPGGTLAERLKLDGKLEPRDRQPHFPGPFSPVYVLATPPQRCFLGTFLEACLQVFAIEGKFSQILLNFSLIEVVATRIERPASPEAHDRLPLPTWRGLDDIATLIHRPNLRQICLEAYAIKLSNTVMIPAKCMGFTTPSAECECCAKTVDRLIAYVASRRPNAGVQPRSLTHPGV
jgi:hypothetical protein